MADQGWDQDLFLFLNKIVEGDDKGSESEATQEEDLLQNETHSDVQNQREKTESQEQSQDEVQGVSDQGESQEENSSKPEEGQEQSEEQRQEERKGEDFKNKLDSGQVDTIRRQTTGLMNRLTDGNIELIFTQIAKICQRRKYLRPVIMERVNQIFFTASILFKQTSINLLLDVNCALLYALSRLYGAKYFLSTLKSIVTLILEKLEYSVKNEANLEEGLILSRNAVIGLINFYHFGCFSIDILGQLALHSSSEYLNSEVGIQIISLIISHLGSSIRKESPLLLREIAAQVSAKKNTAMLEQNRKKHSSRFVNKLLFLEQDITDLKNNIHKKYDPLDRLKPLRSWFRSNSLLKSELEGPLLLSLESITLHDFKRLTIEELNSKIFEEAKIEIEEGNIEGFEPEKAVQAEGKLQRLASALHMSTPTRKAVFFSLMGAEDVSDAFEKLTRLKLKKQDEREIVKVTVACCLSEKSFNPYYAEVLGKFLEMHYSFRYSYQYTLWDYSKTLEKLNLRKIHNLAKLTSVFLFQGSLPFAALRGLNLSIEMKPVQELFIKIMLSQYFSKAADQEAKEKVVIHFRKLAAHEKVGAFQRGMQMFLTMKLHDLDFSKWTKSYEKAKQLVRLAVRQLDRSAK